MHLVLTLPGILAPAADRDVRASHLARLLAIAGPPKREPDGIDAMLAAFYGIQRPAEADCPLAPVRLAALGVDPGSSFWLRADPVTLIAGRDDVRLEGIVQDLGANDAAILTAMLNAHFETDGIAFVAARPDVWFVRAPARIALRTRPVAVVTGRTLRNLLPTGADAGTWQRWQSEIQMLLHEHPVNMARERDGKAPANSLWFSEGGGLTARASIVASVSTFANGGVATALAVHANHPARPAPESLRTVIAAVDDASTLVVALDAPLAFDEVERGWAAPAWKALMEHTLDAVTLIADGGDGAVAWTVGRPNFRQRIALRFARRDLGSLLAAAHERP